MPLQLAQVLSEENRELHILALVGEASSKIENYQHSWIKWGQIGLLFKVLEQNDCKDVVIVGSVSRPDIRNMRFDFGAIKTLPFILSLMSGGDDSILSRIVHFFENKGYAIRGVQDVAPQFLVSSGVLTSKKPNRQDEKDIQMGLSVVQTLGALDVGQAAVVAKEYVLAVEAAEGTDAMLERAGDLRQWGRKNKKSGVLVKCPKPGQEQRIDMPTIGSHTVQMAAKAGLNGIAVAAGQVLIVDQDELVTAAKEHNIFVIGYEQPEKIKNDR